MKKMFITLLAICFVLAGCSDGVAQNESSVSPSEIDSSISEPEAAQSEPEPNSNPEPDNTDFVLFENIEFEDGTNLIFSLSDADNGYIGSAICNFDGADINIEMSRLAALFSIFDSLEAHEYTVMITSGQETGFVMYSNGEMQPTSALPDSYMGKEVDSAAIESEIEFILAHLKDAIAEK